MTSRALMAEIIDGWIRVRRVVAPVVAFVVAVVVFLAVTKGPVFHARMDRGPLDGDFIDDPWTQSVFVLVYVIAIAALALHPRVGVPRRVASWVVAPSLVLLAAVAWSPHRQRAFEQASMMLLGCLAALAIGAMLSPRRLLWAVWTAMAVGLIVSFRANSANWPFSHGWSGDIVGIYFNSNSYGAVAIMFAFASAALIAVAFDEKVVWRRAVVVAAGGVGVLFGAVIVAPIAALTPVVGALVAIGAAAVILVRRRLGRALPPWAVRSAVAIGAALLAGAAIEVHDGRLSTVGDRLEIWTVVSRFVRHRPLMGWGLMSAWLENEMSRQIQAYGGRIVHESHNGFLEITLGGGLTALVAVVGAVVVAFRVTGRVAARSADLASLWPFAAVVYCVIVNLGETYIGANLLPWTLLVAATGCAVRRPDPAGPGGQARIQPAPRVREARR